MKNRAIDVAYVGRQGLQSPIAGVDVKEEMCNDR